MKDFFIPFKGVFCRVEPLVFDGTLSFLECLAKLQDYANKLNANITAINTLIEAIETELEGKQDTLTFDSVPTDGSTNPVESNGIYDALAGKQNTLTFDTAPTDGSNNPVTSNGIFDALAGKQNELTFDANPTENSRNPVFSGGVYNALVNIETEVSHLQPFIVTISYNPDTEQMTSDKTFNEILTAYNSGNPLICTFPMLTPDGIVIGRTYMSPSILNNAIMGFGFSVAQSILETVYTFIIMYNNAITYTASNYETVNGSITRVENALHTSTEYTNTRERAIRKDFTNKFFDVHVSSIVSPVLPSGVTYAIINERAAEGCVVRMHFIDAGMWLYYTDICAFMGYDAGNDSTIVAKVAQNGTISFA